MDHGKEWLREHLATIGGTGATCVRNVNRFRSFEQYWQLMKDARQGVLPDSIDSPDLKRGRYFEDDARQIVNEDPTYCATIDPHDQSKFCYNKSMQWDHCIPEGWEKVQRPDAAGRTMLEEILCEIKIPRPETFRKILMNGLTDEYMVQAQHNMMVLDFDSLYFVVLNPVTLDAITSIIHRDFDFTDKLAIQEAYFFDSLAYGSAPPAPPKPGQQDPLFEDEDEIPKSQGKAFVVSPDNTDAIIAAYQLAESKADVAVAKDAYNTALAMFTEAVGKHDVSQVAGVCTVHRVPMPGREKFDKKGALKEFPQIKKYISTGEPFEQVRVILDAQFKAQQR